MQKPFGAAHRGALVHVVAHEPDLLDVAHVPGHAADGADLAVVIDHADIAFGRAVELHDARDLEALLEARPDLRTQTVADGDPQTVLALERIFRRVQQIAAELADILEHGRLVAAAIVPEFGGGEFVAQHERAAAEQRRPERADAAGRMIERQHVVHAVVGLRRSPRPGTTS